jgi:hypothetical protein
MIFRKRFCFILFCSLSILTLKGIILAEDKEEEWNHTEVFSNKEDNSATVIMRNPILKWVPKGYIFIERAQTLITKAPPSMNYIVKTEKIFEEQSQFIHSIQSNTILKQEANTIILQKERKEYKVFIIDLEADNDHYLNQFKCYSKKLQEYPAEMGVYRVHWIFKSAYEPYFEMRWPISSKSYHLYNTNQRSVQSAEVGDAFNNTVLQQFSNEAKGTNIEFLIITTPESNLFEARYRIKQLKRPQDEKKQINTCFLTEECKCHDRS